MAERLEELYSQPPPAVAERYAAWAALRDSPRFPAAAAEQQTVILYELAAAAAQHPGWSEPDALGRAVGLLDDALAVAPREQDLHGRVAIALAETAGLLYQRTTDDAVLSVWAERATGWLRFVAADDWRMPLYVLAMGVLLYHRAKVTGDAQDVQAAIEALQTARGSVRRRSGVHGTASAYLADLRLSSYRQHLDPGDLEAALHDAWNTVRSERANPAERYVGLVTLASALAHRHVLGGEDADILEASRYARLALEAATGETQRVAAQQVQAIAYRHRYRLTHDPADLDVAITAWQQLAERATWGAEQQAGYLDNHSNCLFDRYELTRRVEDLTESIRMSRAALAMLPPDSPTRARVLGNLGASLALAYQDHGDIGRLDEAVQVSRQAVAADLDPHDAPKLWAQLASMLTQRALVGPPDVGLLDEALAAYDRSTALLEQPGGMPVEYALGRQRVWWALSDRHVAALLQRASLADEGSDGAAGHAVEAGGARYLRRALEVGEAAKSRLLASAVMRASLLPPPEVPDELETQEQYLLGQLDHIDAVEFAAVGAAPTIQRLEMLERRQTVRRHLTAVWAQMAAIPAAADYVALRQGTATGLLNALDSRDPGTAYVAVLPVTDVARGPGHGNHGACGLAVLALRPGRPDPVLATTGSDVDPVPDAVRRFAAEVPGDAGHGLRDETWHHPLVACVRQVVEALGAIVTYVVSPPTHGRSLPWHLVLERAGWPAPDQPGGVVTVPTLAVVAATAGHEPQHDRRVPVRVIRDHDPGRAAERGIALLRRAGAVDPRVQPLVVGDPTGDLPGAAEEAREVAEVLGAQPLLGAAATVEQVRLALETAPTAHLAAHAQFSPESPLDSPILLTDGPLPARALVETGSNAELVVLLACESGVGGVLTGGEIAGLTHALLRAGTRAVIASLWPVNDTATAFLMGAFYRRRAGGASVPAALALAMQQTRAQPGWEHPYFWSGFVVTQRGEA